MSLQPERIREPNPNAEDEAYDKWRQKRDETQMVQHVRFSHLRAFGRSAAHGLHALQGEEKAATTAMQRGTAVHALVFGNRKVLPFDGQRRGKAYDAFAAENADALIITAAEYEKSQAMAASVRDCKLAIPLLQGTVEETLSFHWNGLDCRATPDVRGGNFLTELKTSASADPSRFLWHARRMAYHAQLKFQEYGCKGKMRDHYIVCVESDAPHPVTVFHVEPEALEEGERLLMLWAERLKNSVASNAFPPYVDCMVPLVWPKDDQIEYGEEA